MLNHVFWGVGIFNLIISVHFCVDAKTNKKIKAVKSYFK